MSQIVEYNGAHIEFPDGMPPAEIEAAIKRSALSLPGKMKAPDPSEGGGMTLRPFGLDTGIEMGQGASRFLAGAGAGLTNLARGAGQFIGAVDRQDVAESRKRDAPLMNTGAGLAGNITGTAAGLLPTALIPGANTYAGAAMIGAGTGLAAPSTSTSETVKNTILGGIAAPATLGLARGVQSLYQGAKGLAEPLTKAGQDRIAADVLRRSATNPQQAAQVAGQAREMVPGSQPTLAQVAQDPGLAQLERTILNNPEYAPALQQRFGDQRLARLNEIQNIAGRGDHYAEIDAGRKLFANQDYGEAIKQGVNKEMAQAMQPQIESLLRRPSMQEAKAVAQRLAAENDKNLTDFGSVEGLDWLKKALDNKISAAVRPGSSIGDAELRALTQTKSDLMKTLEQIAPAYKMANDNFAAMSKQVNSMDVAMNLLGTLNKPGSRYMQPGTAKEMGSAYSDALAKSFDSVKKATGMDKNITQVMPAQDVAMLENIARDLGRKSFTESAGKATGSPTAQNLASQNMLRRILGPTGLPESWAESSMLQGMLSPVQMGSKLSGADRKIMDRIAQGLLDPMDGIGLLTSPQAIRSVGLLGASNAQRYLPAVGLLGVSEK